MVTATVKGGLFAQYGSTVSLVDGTGSGRRFSAMALGKKSFRALRELMTTLNGAAAGGAALATNARIEANEELGGLRVVETENLVNRNTTADDVTEINNTVLSLSSRTYDPTPPANLDGNPLGTR
jgi:hypothetical protein